MRFDNAMTDGESWDFVQRIWFEKFALGNSPALSGFEHVFVGEQK